MKSRLLLLTLLLSVLPAALCAQDAECRRRFEEELAAKSREIRTIACRFEQVRKSAVLKDEVRKTGLFHCKRPGRMRLLFADGDRITMNGSDFLLVESGRKTVMKMQSNPMLRELQRLLEACMTADMERLTTGFVPTLRETEKQYELTLAPRRKNRLQEIVLHFAKKDMSLDELRMNQTSGDYLLYRFSDKRFDEPVVDEWFEIGE